MELLSELNKASCVSCDTECKSGSMYINIQLTEILGICLLASPNDLNV